MSYHIYTTEGIIIKRTVFGEANLLLYILTSDLGLIMASARSARLSVSKLRPSLQEGANITISCVKGKSGWKVTNASYIQNFYFDNRNYVHKVIANIKSLLIKMIPGEFNNQSIFKITKEAFEAVSRIDDKVVVNFETIVVTRVLFELGYLAKDSLTEKYLVDYSDFSLEILNSAILENKMLISVINNSLKASQL